MALLQCVYCRYYNYGQDIRYIKYNPEKILSPDSPGQQPGNSERQNIHDHNGFCEAEEHHYAPYDVFNYNLPVFNPFPGLYGVRREPVPDRGSAIRNHGDGGNATDF